MDNPTFTLRTLGYKVTVERLGIRTQWPGKQEYDHDTKCWRSPEYSTEKNNETVYEQTVPELNLTAVILAVNGIERLPE